MSSTGICKNCGRNATFGPRRNIKGLSMHIVAELRKKQYCNKCMKDYLGSETGVKHLGQLKVETPDKNDLPSLLANLDKTTSSIKEFYGRKLLNVCGEMEQEIRRWMNEETMDKLPKQE